MSVPPRNYRLLWNNTAPHDGRNPRLTMLHISTCSQRAVPGSGEPLRGVLAKSNEDLQHAKSMLSKELKQLSLSLYDPALNPDKAAQGSTRSGFEYLGCLIQKGQIEPSRAAKEKLLIKITAEIRRAMVSIAKLQANPKLSRGREITYAKSLANIDEVIRGWSNSFRFVNNRLPLRQLDNAIEKHVVEFDNWFRGLKMLQNAQCLSEEFLNHLNHMNHL